MHIGQPDKITTIFGLKVTKHYSGELKTVIEDLDLPDPVIRRTTWVWRTVGASGLVLNILAANRMLVAQTHKSASP